jgi:hypothetical protein
VNKQAVLSMLVHRGKAVCDTSSLPEELKFLHETVQVSGYSEWQNLRGFQSTKESPITIQGGSYFGGVLIL